MKIFFAVSPRAIPSQKNEFTKIYQHIEKLGHVNVNDIPVAANPETFYDCSQEDIEAMYQDLMKKCKEADVLIIETTIHSLSMGYYIKLGLDLDKPVIILHKPGYKPFFFSGIKNELLQITEYTEHTIPDVIDECLAYAKNAFSIRFNMFLSPELNAYLKWASKETGTLRSSFFRSLLIQHLEQHEEEYQSSLKK